MGIDDFERWWRVRERADIVRLIGALDAASGVAGGEVCHARACAELGVALRRAGRHRTACLAAHAVRSAAIEACRRTGVLDEDHAGSVRLARAAGEAARALLCGGRLPSGDDLLAPFRAELPLLAAS
ncbi:MAG TPA: hypothetical protein VFU14_08125 [Acidimicrobiales bacterium]|nr:hypothetical protein [Acidimicrobiales bacterium]